MADRPSEQQARPTAAAPQRGATGSAPGSAKGTATDERPPLTQRLSAMVSGAADEHRANARPAAERPAASPGPAAGGAAGRRPPRRARLRLTRIDPWSVMKTAFLLAVATAVVTVVSVAIVWSVLGAAGVWESINATVADVVGTDATSGFDVRDYVGTSRILGFTVLVSAINVVLLTAIATLAAFLYNMAAALLGGVELTLAEDDR